MTPHIESNYDQFTKNILNENIKLKKENRDIKQNTVNLSCLIDELSCNVDNVIKYGQQHDTHGNRMANLAKFSVGLNLILAITVALNFIAKYS